MIRRRTLRFAFACSMVSAGLSHASLAAALPAVGPGAEPLTSGQPAPAPEQPAQPSQPPAAQPAPEQPAQPSQPPPAQPSPDQPAQPSQPPAAQPPSEQPAQPSQPPSAPVAPVAPVAPAPAQPAPIASSPAQPTPPARSVPAPPTKPSPSLQFARTQTAQLAPTQPAPAQPAPPAAPGTTQPAQPSPYAPTMQAGGLAPPPPMDEKTAQTPSTPTTPEKPDDDDDDDSGRGLDWVYLDVEGGFQHVGLETFDVDEESFTVGFIPTTATGAAIGVGLGAQLFFITIGARGRLGLLDAWQYFTVGGELGLRFPLGNFEPHVNLGGGYAAVGSFSDAPFGAESSVSIRGFYARAGGGLDYFITPVFSIGGAASWEFTAMTRPGLDPSEIADIETDPTIESVRRQQAKFLALEGSGYGSAFTLTAVLGLHL